MSLLAQGFSPLVLVALSPSILSQHATEERCGLKYPTGIVDDILGRIFKLTKSSLDQSYRTVSLWDGWRVIELKFLTCQRKKHPEIYTTQQCALVLDILTQYLNTLCEYTHILDAKKFVDILQLNLLFNLPNRPSPTLKNEELLNL